MNSKRIQKHLIDRDDTLYYNTGFERCYVDTHNGINGINFALTIWSKDANSEDESVTFYYDAPLAIELAMRLVMPDLRKWRVLKNGK